ncbi:hypothetical protein F0U60_31090 [Archangium minus]|uniref:SGNH hydrolase-type esterase domain-containing protein n=1 Tax=Archangium minus TaxID=83450 RepID=A0ABY9WY86_9BACT|nr:hypothetical protein F0U60_31090 [Archangium minus]
MAGRDAPGLLGALETQRLSRSASFLKLTSRIILAAALLWAAACNTPSPSEPSASSTGAQGTARLSSFDPLPRGFDWSMEDRFPKDTDGNGVREFSYETYVNAKSFAVQLDGCPTTEAGYSYRWNMSGKSWTGADWQATYLDRGCRFSLYFPGQGDFSVTLTIQAPSGESRDYTQTVTVKDLLIVGLGDSYGSGEGNPDIPANESWDGKAKWADPRCHRSFKASSALVALQLEEEDRRTSVTYVSLACSGANISRETFVQGPFETFKTSGNSQGSGLLGRYIGIEHPYPENGPWSSSQFLEPQIEQLQRISQGRRIDALVISAGGNDMGFGDVLKHCVVTSTCHGADSWDGRHLEANVRGLSNALPARYVELADTLHSRLNVANVFLTEYPDLSRDQNGETCYELMDDISNDLGIRFDGIRRSQGEPQWIQQNFLAPLNQHMRNAVQTQQQLNRPWHYVGGVEEEFRNHGMCAGSARWFRSGPESAVLQGPLNNISETTGTAHPNEEGHHAYARHILASLRATDPRFAPDGTLLRVSGTDTVYLVVGGAKVYVPSWDFLSNYYGLGEAHVREVSQTTLDAFPSIPREGTGLREENRDTVYAMYGGQKYPFASPLAAITSGFPAERVRVVPSGALSRIPTGRVFEQVDVNGDGCTDLVRTLNTQGLLGLSVSLSDCAGRYQAPWTNLNMGAGSGAVEWLTGDADADGRTDLFQLWDNFGSLGLIVWRSNGTGYEAFADTSGVQMGVGAVKFLAVDVNKDKRTDIVQLWNNNGTLAMSLHQSYGNRYTTSWTATMPAGVGAVEWLTGDADADGQTDIFQLWNNFGSLGLIVWRSNGAGYEPFADTSGIAAGVGAVKFLAVDVNKDKRTDIVQLWNNNGTLAMSLHQSYDNRYATNWSGVMPAGVGAVEWLTGDADADGQTDLFQLWDHSGSLRLIVWRSNGTGYELYGNTAGIAAGSGALKFLVSDINHDGRTDLLQCWNNAGQLNVLVHAQDSGAFSTTWNGNMGRL